MFWSKQQASLSDKLIANTKKSRSMHAQRIQTLTNETIDIVYSHLLEFSLNYNESKCVINFSDPVIKKKMVNLNLRPVNEIIEVIKKVVEHIQAMEKDKMSVTQQNMFLIVTWKVPEEKKPEEKEEKKSEVEEKK